MYELCIVELCIAMAVRLCMYNVSFPFPSSLAEYKVPSVVRTIKASKETIMQLRDLEFFERDLMGRGRISGMIGMRERIGGNHEPSTLMDELGSSGRGEEEIPDRTEPRPNQANLNNKAAHGSFATRFKR